MGVSRPQRCKNKEGCSFLCELCEIYLGDNNGRRNHIGVKEK